MGDYTDSSRQMHIFNKHLSCLLKSLTQFTEVSILGSLQRCHLTTDGLQKILEFDAPSRRS